MMWILAPLVLRHYSLVSLVHAPAELVITFTLGDLLDKPCRGHRWCLPFSPPARALFFIAHRRVQHYSFMVHRVHSHYYYGLLLL